MDNLAGIKELFDVTIRAAQPIEINGRKIDINEPILTFDRVDIGQVREVKSEKKSIGGINNTFLVGWEIDKEVDFAITHGTLSPISYALLSNSQLKNKRIKSVPLIVSEKAIELDEGSYIDLSYIPNCIEDKLGLQPNPDFEPVPVGRRPELMLKPLPPSKTKWIFCYDEETGRRIRDFSICGCRVYFPKSYRGVTVNYTFDCEDNVKVLEVGNRLISGFLKLDGKMSVKDEKSGNVTTAILELPRIRISSSLSMKLGKGYNESVVGDFYFTAYPEEECKKNSPVARISFLNIDVTGDYI